MATVALLGYSCAGKSTIVRQVTERWPEVEGVDSDKWVAQPHEHIYEVYFEHGSLGAKHHVDYRERTFLNSLEPVDGPRIIAVGPAVPSRRPQWDAFVDRVKPTFIYLVLSPEEELARLRARRTQHARDTKIAHNPEFGAWDSGLTTERTNAGTWAEVDNATALKNIRQHINGLVPIYQHHTDAEHRYQAKDGSSVIQEVGRLLQVEETARQQSPPVDPPAQSP